MRLVLKLKRLEAQAGVNDTCAWCRWSLRSNFANPANFAAALKKLEPLLVHCDVCGNQYSVALPDDPFSREVTREYHSYSVEQCYSEHRAHALLLWLSHYKKIRATETQKTKRAAGSNYERAHAKEVSLNKKKRKEMMHAALACLRKVHLKAGKKYKGAHPDLDVLEKELFGKQAYSLSDMQAERTTQLEALSKIESILWERPRPETVAAIEAHQKAIELRGREDEAREEKQQQERLERERQRLERMHTPQAVRATPVGAAAHIEPIRVPATVEAPEVWNDSPYAAELENWRANRRQS